MNVKVSDLMREKVITTTPSVSALKAKDIMLKNGLHLLPVVDPDNSILGVLSSTDMLEEHSAETPVSAIMTKEVTTIPAYSDISQAARALRNNKIHRILVTHEKRLVGILSSFDLLKLIEGKRFVEKNPSTPKTKRREHAPH